MVLLFGLCVLAFDLLPLTRLGCIRFLSEGVVCCMFGCKSVHAFIEAQCAYTSVCICDFRFRRRNFDVLCRCWLALFRLRCGYGSCVYFASRFFVRPRCAVYAASGNYKS